MICFKNKEYSNEEIQKLIDESTSISEILRKIGVKDSGGNHVKLKKYLTENNFKLDTLVGRKLKRYNNKGIRKKKLSEVLIENSTGNSSRLKYRLIEDGIKKWCCEKCNNSTYDGETIPLELHHVNGNHFDNRIENLLLLCPICHARTNNYRGKKEQYDKVYTSVAQKNAEGIMDKLLEKELIEEKIYRLRRIERGEGSITPDVKRKPREKNYCQVCGAELKNNRKKFCSIKCATKFQSKNEYNKENFLACSKKVHSILEMAKEYKITDNALRKHLKKFGILDECKQNFLPIKRRIRQYDINGKFIKEWDCASDIEKVLGLNKDKIRQTCAGKQKTSGGFIWKYEQ